MELMGMDLIAASRRMGTLWPVKRRYRKVPENFGLAGQLQVTTYR
jgi:hypothetical protein